MNTVNGVNATDYSTFNDFQRAVIGDSEGVSSWMQVIKLKYLWNRANHNTDLGFRSWLNEEGYLDSET